MEKSITISVKMVFGRECYYPECELSKIIADILDAKGLGLLTLEKLAKHGFEIKYKVRDNVLSSTLSELGAKKL